MTPSTYWIIVCIAMIAGSIAQTIWAWKNEP
jgi:hypothetical protein